MNTCVVSTFINRLALGTRTLEVERRRPRSRGGAGAGAWACRGAVFAFRGHKTLSGGLHANRDTNKSKVCKSSFELLGMSDIHPTPTQADPAEGREALKPQVNGPRTPPTPLCKASTRAHSGWFTRSRSCVALPNTNPTKSSVPKNRTTTIIKTRRTTVQKPSNNRQTTVKQPYKNRSTKTGTTTPQNSNFQKTEHTINPQPAPQDPRAALVPPLAYTSPTPRHTALRRGEGGRWPTRRGLPEGPPLPSKK